MQHENVLNGFPAGYFLIRAINSTHRGKNMLLDVSRSERQPGIELGLWVDETQSLWPFGNDWNDSQVFFMCQDGTLRSKATGHPIGCRFDDQLNTLRLVVQPPLPFNHRSEPYSRFSYDLQSKKIIVHRPEEKNNDHTRSLTRCDTGDSSASVGVTSEEEAPLGDTRLRHVLEFVPKGHRYRQLSHLFNGAPEPAGHALRSRTSSSSIVTRSSSGTSFEGADIDDSWHKGREVRMIRWRGGTTRFQEWDIIPLGSPSESCDDPDDEWIAID